MLHPASFFNLTLFKHQNLFPAEAPVWTALTRLKSYMNKYRYPQMSHPLLKPGLPLPEPLIWHEERLISTQGKEIVLGDACKQGLIIKDNGRILEGASLIMAGASLIGDQISLGKGVLVETGAMIKSPTIIGDYCEIRQGAYLRGYCLAGAGCVLGHSTEIKHSIMLDGAKAGHFNYLGDSILGNNTNLGAGTKLANLRFLPGNVHILHDKKQIDSGLRKFGAIMGDDSQTGCNSVTSPGTVLGKKCMLMPNTTTKSGYHPDKTRI
ncbi:acyltransferase [Desulfotalea psychrophila]|uniref:Probable bifunctional GlmU protein n=1 Tax=Desulfotalea psychrophila (strain LSv54 / DSM 12343) TaxID=177439 RepID=Q6AJ28_DESPS|nr:bifunctional GlmU protein [Desulfotalea psychrophila]CAG37652.1 probable bifunctional GlmU protein [Desulfotalea psychrophila LSv54]